MMQLNNPSANARSKLSTACAVLTLALGIGSAAAIFSVVNAVMLKALPYREPGRVFQVVERQLKTGGLSYYATPGNFFAWRERAKLVEGFSVALNQPVSWTGPDAAVRLEAANVGADFFSLLGVDAVSGRLFHPAEDRPEAPPVVILSHGFWQTRFGARPDAVGRTMVLDGKQHVIAGVLPPEFFFPGLGSIDVWRPSALDPRAREDRYGHWLPVVTRLRSGATLQQAQAELDSIAAALGRQYPDTNADTRVRLVPLLQQTSSLLRPAERAPP